MKITFIIHGKLAESKLESLKKEILLVFKGFEINFLSTTAESGATEQTRIAIEQGAKYILIAGGDGSINEAVNGYMKVSEALQKTVALGIYPIGTGNDFAKSLQVTKSLKELLQLIKNKAIQKVDICKMDYIGLTNQPESRYFINIADIGIGGFVAEKIGKSSRVLGANLTYLLAIITSFLSYKKQAIVLKSPKMNWKGKVMSLCMANGKYFGNGMCIAPDAKLNDGVIQLTILGGISLLDYIKNISKIKKGVKVTHKKVLYTSVKELSIHSVAKESPIDMDGEFIGYTPIEVKIFKQKINILGKILE